MPTIAAVPTTHPLYRTYQDTWTKLGEVVEGSGGFLDGTALVAHPREWVDHKATTPTTRYTREEAIRFGRRTAALLRAFNLRCGIGPELEYPSARYGSTPHDGPTAGVATRPHWEHMLDVWYAQVGYDRRAASRCRSCSSASGSPS